MTRRITRLFFLLSSLSYLTSTGVSSLHAVLFQSLYWDVNGSAPGTGPDSGGYYDGTWGADSFWSPDPTGNTVPGPWVTGSDAVFSAGGNPSADSFITIAGIQTANSILVADGIVRFRFGMADTGSGPVTVNAGATLEIDSTQRLNMNAGKVVLNGGTLLQIQPGQAGSFIGSATGLKGLEVGGTGTIAYDDGDGMPDDKVTLYFGTITGTGGTTVNGGAGTLIKTGPDQFGVAGRDLGGGLNSQSQFTFAKLVVKQGGYRGRGVMINGQLQIDERVFGAVPLTTLPDAITLDGGGIGVNVTTTLNPNRGITIGPNGGYLDHGAGASLSIPGPLSGTGTLTIGDITSTLVSNPTFTLSNSNNANTFSGGLVGFRGLLQLNSPLKVASLNDGALNNASIAIASGQILTVGNDSGNDTWSTVISGAGGFTKTGHGTQHLTGILTYTGDTRIDGGTLSITHNYLADGADVYVSTHSKFELSFAATDIIRSLYIDNILQPAGTWGAVGSGAQHTTSLIIGGGLLSITVGSVPEPSSSCLAAFSLVFGVTCRGRRAISQTALLLSKR